MTSSRSSRQGLVIATLLAFIVFGILSKPSRAIPWSQPSATAVVQGRDDASDPYPFVAAIGYADSSGTFLWDNQFCDGGLVAPDLVLTTAHCVEGTTPEELAVVVGRNVMSSDQGQVRSIAAVIVNPDYNPDNAANDLAVLRLSQPVVGITPITVVGTGDPSFNAAGTPLMLATWGEARPAADGTATAGTQEQLHLTTVHVVDDATCAQAWARTGYQDDSVWGLFVCTTPGEFQRGDSGSPLFVATPRGDVQVSMASGSYAARHKHKHPNTDPTLYQEIPDYGPELGAPSSAQFLASVGI